MLSPLLKILCSSKLFPFPTSPAIASFVFFAFFSSGTSLFTFRRARKNSIWSAVCTMPSIITSFFCVDLSRCNVCLAGRMSFTATNPFPLVSTSMQSRTTPTQLDDVLLFSSPAKDSSASWANMELFILSASSKGKGCQVVAPEY